MIPRFKTEQNLSPSLCSLASEILRGLTMEERKKKNSFFGQPYGVRDGT